MTTEYRIAPYSRPDFELAGDGNSFDTFDSAREATFSMDETCPLEDVDEWWIYVRNDLGAWRRY